ISYAIKYYLRIGNNINSGKKISLAIENLLETSVAHIELCRDHMAPIIGEFAGFVQGQALSNIE
ncbi:19690_t:CDS:2, partial [Dentiscutata erythropus]